MWTKDLGHVMIVCVSISRSSYSISKKLGKEKYYGFVNLKPGTDEMIKRNLIGKGENLLLRIDLCSNGCCDGSLGKFFDAARETDLIQKAGDLIFVISPNIYSICGEVTIACAGNNDSNGFVVTSENPINE
jgi:hypothetical protein